MNDVFRRKNGYSTPEFRAMAAHMAKACGSDSMVALALGVSPPSVRNWRRCVDNIDRIRKNKWCAPAFMQMAVDMASVRDSYLEAAVALGLPDTTIRNWIRKANAAKPKAVKVSPKNDENTLK